MPHWPARSFFLIPCVLFKNEKKCFDDEFSEVLEKASIFCVTRPSTQKASMLKRQNAELEDAANNFEVEKEDAVQKTTTLDFWYLLCSPKYIHVCCLL